MNILFTWYNTLTIEWNYFFLFKIFAKNPMRCSTAADSAVQMLVAHHKWHALRSAELGDVFVNPDIQERMVSVYLTKNVKKWHNLLINWINLQYFLAYLFFATSSKCSSSCKLMCFNFTIYTSTFKTKPIEDIFLKFVTR